MDVAEVGRFLGRFEEASFRERSLCIFEALMEGAPRWVLGSSLLREQGTLQVPLEIKWKCE